MMDLVLIFQRDWPQNTKGKHKNQIFAIYRKNHIGKYISYTQISILLIEVVLLIPIMAMFVSKMVNAVCHKMTKMA